MVPLFVGRRRRRGEKAARAAGATWRRRTPACAFASERRRAPNAGRKVRPTLSEHAESAHSFWRGKKCAPNHGRTLRLRYFDAGSAHSA